MRTHALFALGLSALAIAAPAHATEEPRHSVLESDGRFQIRAYEPMIVAAVDVDASRRNASNAGFQPLADYIFGANRQRAKIDMTAPVVQAPSVKIDMTAPVVQSPSGPDVWRVTFMMPSSWTMDTLPEPLNPDVQLIEQPAQTMAVVRFSGVARPDSQLARQAELEAWIKTTGWRATGPAQVAFYDPPWTPAPFRRNEILIPVSR